MKEMNKEFEYRRYHFNIKVKLNTRVAKCSDGPVYHTVITNCMDFDNYYVTEEVKDEFLTIAVEDAERLAKKYVDKELDEVPTPDSRLKELGFK